MAVTAFLMEMVMIIVFLETGSRGSTEFVVLGFIMPAFLREMVIIVVFLETSYEGGKRKGPHHHRRYP